MARPRKKPRLSGEGTPYVGAEQSGEAAVPTTADGESAVADSAASKKAAKPSRQLFIRSLPSTVTEESLTEHFSQSYPLKHVVLVRDPTTKTSKGYGFVTFVDIEDATRAKEEFDKTDIDGHKITVDFAEHRHRGAEDPDDADNATSSKTKKGAKTQQGPEYRKPPKLIVRNLPWSVKEPEQLAKLFQSYGKVKHATIPKKKPGLLAGFGFVVLRGYKNAEKAVAGVNGKVVDGRTIAVDWAVEKDVWEELQQKERQAKETEEGEHDENSSEDGNNLKGIEEIGSIGAGDAGDVSDAGFDVDPELERAEEEDDREEDDDWEDDGHKVSQAEDKSSTAFVRNVPFSATDDSLYALFKEFGPVRYARVVMEPATDRPRGTAFVCFYRKEDCDKCLREAPRRAEAPVPSASGKKPNSTAPLVKYSVLENELADPTGRYTLDGRVLHLSRAVDRDEAAKLREQGHSLRNSRDRDKRRLYLLSEGTVSPSSPLYQLLSPAEIKIREASAKQRKSIIQSNPSLHLSLTRLSVRNVPRSMTSKDLKALARQAVVEFAQDVKAKKRLPLSKEELRRAGSEMKEAERERKVKGKGIVTQAKVVFEGREGGKVTEDSGAGRSRGYGFIEYSSHRWALMGLRWLNGHAIDYTAKGEQKQAKAGQERLHKQKRLIVEFSIENAQVVARRRERESKARERSKLVAEKRGGAKLVGGTTGADTSDPTPHSASMRGRKRKRSTTADGPKDSSRTEGAPNGSTAAMNAPQISKEQLAKQQRIIGKKRMQRRAKKSVAGK